MTTPICYENIFHRKHAGNITLSLVTRLLDVAHREIECKSWTIIYVISYILKYI